MLLNVVDGNISFKILILIFVNAVQVVIPSTEQLMFMPTLEATGL